MGKQLSQALRAESIDNVVGAVSRVFGEFGPDYEVLSASDGTTAHFPVLETIAHEIESQSVELNPHDMELLMRGVLLTLASIAKLADAKT